MKGYERISIQVLLLEAEQDVITASGMVLDDETVFGIPNGWLDGDM